jgi:Zn-dependent protease with chaperone function
MPALPSYYPPSPAVVPNGLTRPSHRYRRQIKTVSYALMVFFLIYFGLIFFSLVLSFVSFASATGSLMHGHIQLAFYKMFLAVSMLATAGLFIKSLFARQKLAKGFEIEVFPDEHPRLFDFLECVCDEVDAPVPERVFINCDVNAAAGSDVSLGSLFRSTERRLYLGLGLLNAINITEFKALLAHEFAHLSQHDSPSGPYVRLGMRVVGNILGQYRALEWLFILIIKLNLKLTREMEYHADLTAVSVTGSDAVPHLLYKCLWADHCMQQLINDLDRAREHGLYSTDIFLHHRYAAKQLRKRRKDPTLGAPPTLPDDPDETVQIFSPDEDEQAAMWSDHPSNYERELNCKARYVRTDFDDNSPWRLFDDIPELRRQASVKFYRQIFKEKGSIEWTPADKVQAFLDEEFAETNFDFDRYGVLYHYRNLQPLDLKGLMAVSNQVRNAPADLVRSHQSIYSAEVKKFAEIYLRHIQEAQLLNAIDNRWFQPRNNRFRIRGKRFRVGSARRLLKEVDGEIRRENEWLALLETRVFVTYYEIALWLDPKRADELARRYRFQFVLQNLWLKLRDHEEPMDCMFEFLGSLRNSQIDERSFHIIISVFRAAYETVKYVLDQAELATFPPLANMPQGEPIRPYILKGDLPSKPTHFDEILRVKWLTKFMDKYLEVRKRLDRLHYKNLGAILALQEQLGAEASRRLPGHPHRA